MHTVGAALPESLRGRFLAQHDIEFGRRGAAIRLPQLVQCRGHVGDGIIVAVSQIQVVKIIIGTGVLHRARDVVLFEKIALNGYGGRGQRVEPRDLVVFYEGVADTAAAGG